MALPGAALRPQNRAAGMGIYYACYYGAMAGLVPVAGALRDATQSPSAPLYFAAAMMLGAGACLAAFRFIQRSDAQRGVARSATTRAATSPLSHLASQASDSSIVPLLSARTICSAVLQRRLPFYKGRTCSRTGSARVGRQHHPPRHR